MVEFNIAKIFISLILWCLVSYFMGKDKARFKYIIIQPLTDGLGNGVRWLKNANHNVLRYSTFFAFTCW